MNGKRQILSPAHKKGGKQIIINYQPVSLLPICSKIFEKIIVNCLFKYLQDNKLLNCNQSSFRSGDSCVHQLLSITHEIYKSFDANPSLELRGVRLDISKTFDRVCHDGLLYKLRLLGICGRYYNLIRSFLVNRHKRVILNDQSSKWSRCGTRLNFGPATLFAIISYICHLVVYKLSVRYHFCTVLFYTFTFILF